MHQQRTLMIVMAAAAALCVARAADSKPEARFKPLPFGEIRPAGWIKAQMEREASGGSLAYYHRAWAVQNKAYELRGHNPDKKDKNSHFWDGCAEGYWGFALIGNAMLVDNPALKRRADAFVADILKTQEADGYIGIYDASRRYQPETVDRDGHRGFLLQGLLYYAQAQGRKDVLDAVERAVQCDMRHFNRSTANLWAQDFMVMSFPQFLDALAQATGKKEYADYAAFVVENYNDAPNSKPYFTDCKQNHLLDINRFFVGHACNTTANLSLPWIAYYANGGLQHKQAGESAFAKFYHQMSVSGSLPGDEDNFGREPFPDIAVEFCTTSFLVENSLIVAEKTGGSRYFDIAERALFNAGMGARLPDGTANAYLKRDSELSLDPSLIANDHMYRYTPSSEPFCCTERMMSMMPVYVSHMFKKTADGKSLAALCYGPATVKTEVAGVKVRVDEKTMYPFESKIEFHMQPEQPVIFEFLVRVPTWAPTATIKCEGAAITRQGEYYSVKKQWNAGDAVAVDFETPVEAIPWINNEYVLKSGPLVFAADLGAVPTKYDKFNSGRSIQEFSDGKLPVYEFTPKEPILWQKCVMNTNQAPSLGFKRMAVKTSNLDQPWDKSPLVLEGEFKYRRKLWKVDLVPMGCTILRRVTFPIGREYPVSREGEADTMMDDKGNSL